MRRLGCISRTHNLFWANGLANVQSRCSTDASLLDNVIGDPRFCDPVSFPGDPSTGDWRVAMNSPVAPGGMCAGWGAEIGICPWTAAQPTSWGRVKALYR